MNCKEFHLNVCTCRFMSYMTFSNWRTCSFHCKFICNLNLSTVILSADTQRHTLQCQGQNLQQWWHPTGLSSPEDLPGLPENQNTIVKRCKQKKILSWVQQVYGTVVTSLSLLLWHRALLLLDKKQQKSQKGRKTEQEIEEMNNWVWNHNIKSPIESYTQLRHKGMSHRLSVSYSSALSCIFRKQTAYSSTKTLLSCENTQQKRR